VGDDRVRALGIGFTADPTGASGDLDLVSDRGVTVDHQVNADAGVAVGRIKLSGSPTAPAPTGVTGQRKAER
jgi:hypothetical protein